MSRMPKLILGLTGAVCALGAAFASPSLKEQRAQQVETAALSRQAAYTSEVCGSTVSASIDWASAGGWPENESLADACDGALSAVESQCRAGRRGLVSRFICAGDGAGASLSGTTLRYGARAGGDAYSETLGLLQSH